MDKHPVGGWRGEHDERTLEHAFNLKADINALRSQLELQRAETERLRAEFRAAFNAQAEENGQLQAALEGSRAQVQAMRISASWRFTQPLRAARRSFGALRPFGRRNSGGRLPSRHLLPTLPRPVSHKRVYARP